MTEAEWLASRSVDEMFEFIQPTVSARKARLLGCACVSWMWQWGLEEAVPEAVYIAEAFADNAATDEELSRAGNDVRALRLEFEESWRPLPRAYEVIECLLSRRDDHGVIGELYTFAADMNVLDEPEWAKMSEFVREIFGNPFRPVSLDPKWLTTDVVALARGIYDERAFDRMPILADALQDAGCTNEDILNHCRDTNQIHVRGCWVVDLVLG